MDSRKAQLTGGSTFTVSLPKEWANENGVEAGRELYLFRRRDGSLIIEPSDDESGSWEAEVRVDGFSEAKLKRTIHALYTAGFDTITIVSPTGFGSLRRTVRMTARKFIGLEIFESTDTTVTFRSLLDPGTVSVHQSAIQLKQVALSMHEDAVTTWLDQDEEYAAHVIERDDQVDRLFGMVSRQFQRVLKSLREAEALDMSQTELYEYHTTARQFERIADHAEKIAEVAVQFENPPQHVFADDIRSASKRARTVVERATSAIIGDAGAETAYDALEKRDALTADLQECGRRLHEDDVPESHLIALTLDSLTRTAEYGGNIAEAALQSAASNAQL